MLTDSAAVRRSPGVASARPRLARDRAPFLWAGGEAWMARPSSHVALDAAPSQQRRVSGLGLVRCFGRMRAASRRAPAPQRADEARQFWRSSSLTRASVTLVPRLGLHVVQTRCRCPCRAPVGGRRRAAARAARARRARAAAAGHARAARCAASGARGRPRTCRRARRRNGSGRTLIQWLPPLGLLQRLIDATTTAVSCSRRRGRRTTPRPWTSRAR